MKKQNGTVTMDLETYNELIKKITKYEESVEVAWDSYQNKPRLEMHVGSFKSLIEEKFSKTQYSNKYVLSLGNRSETIYGAFEEITKGDSESDS